MFEQVFKNVDDTLWKDAGCGSELDYIEQTSWVLFLKYLSDLERDRKDEAKLTKKSYRPLIKGEFRWQSWAIEQSKHLTGDDLIDFVNAKLFPYLKKFRRKASAINTMEYKIGEIFSELTKFRADTTCERLSTR